MAHLPFIPGMTETARDAEPIVFELADALERNPALALADQSQMMEVVSKLAENRMNVRSSYHRSLTAMEDAFMKETDPHARVDIAMLISKMRKGPYADTDEEGDDREG